MEPHQIVHCTNPRPGADAPLARCPRPTLGWASLRGLQNAGYWFRSDRILQDTCLDRPSWAILLFIGCSTFSGHLSPPSSRPLEPLQLRNMLATSSLRARCGILFASLLLLHVRWCRQCGVCFKGLANQSLIVPWTKLFSTQHYRLSNSSRSCWRPE